MIKHIWNYMFKLVDSYEGLSKILLITNNNNNNNIQDILRIKISSNEYYIITQGEYYKCIDLINNISLEINNRGITDITLQDIFNFVYDNIFFEEYNKEKEQEKEKEQKKEELKEQKNKEEQERIKLELRAKII